MWQGPLIAALSKTLLALDGTPAQLGVSGVDGKSLPYIIQELIDFQTYAQIDNGTGFWRIHLQRRRRKPSKEVCCSRSRGLGFYGFYSMRRNTELDLMWWYPTGYDIE